MLIRKDPEYIYYLLYLVCFAVWILNVWSMPHSIWGNIDWDVISLGLLGFSAMMFSYHFLDLKRYEILRKTVYMCSVLYIVFSGLAFFNNDVAFYLIQALSAVGSPMLLFSGLYVYVKRRELHTLIYVFAYGVFLVGVAVNVLYNFRILENFHFRSGLLYGTAVEAVVMLVAIGRRIYQLDLERRYSYRQLAKLVYPHQLQQIRQGINIESTMPVGDSNACVLAFDVIASSQVNDSSFAERWETFMQKVRTIMMHKYDETQMVSTGYIIKEMGDGFLCSVGYPFVQPTDSPEDFCVQLADTLVRLFHQEMDGMSETNPIHCSVGIAKGPVKAYFSGSGAIRHDLWGRGVVLATRYEEMRREVFRILEIPSESIICVQNDLFQTLTEQTQADFQMVPLRPHGVTVRNQPDADALAVKLYRSSRLQRKAS
ncbi:MAG: hypothetical protein HRU19_01875 [Pseudobacteriovorax sp.]|nr:hypothetical protein [Pseudobacteriovorax sp.]